MSRKAKGKGFSLRSGNGPLPFKQMGSSSVMSGINNFGLVKHDSPLDKLSWEDALKADPKLNDYVAERDKHEVGSAEYEAQQALINKAHGTERDQTLKQKQIDNLNKEKEKIADKNDNTINPDDVTTEKEVVEKKGGGLGKVLSGIGKVGVGALTAGLDAVYGTGKVQFASGGGTRFVPGKTKGKKKDGKEGEEKVNELLNK